MELTTVYQYFAANGALIYVGITNRGTRRLHEHADSKPWWHLATGCTLEHFESREAALVREATLIARYRPPYNTQHNPERDVPLEVRAAKRLRSGIESQLAAGNVATGKALKKRRAAWYALDREQRLTAPCVECGARPGITGPSCLPCRQLTALISTQRPDAIKAIAVDKLSAGDVRELLDRLRQRAAERPLLASENRLYHRLQGRLALDTPAPPETPERVAISTPECA